MRRHPFASFCALAALAGCNPDNMEPNPARNPINPPLPTSTLTATSDTVPALADALIRTSSRHSNHGGAQTMMVKITQSQDDSTRVVISFDQAAIAAAIGSGTLTRATLELGIEQSGTESENRLDAHRLVMPWTESGVTWRCGTDLNLANASADCPATKWRMSGPDMDAFVATRTDRAHLNPGQTYPETTCAWRTTTCGGVGKGTNDEYLLPWATAFSPTGDHAVLAVSVHRTIATFNGDWKPCPWSVPNPVTGAPSDECLDSITYEKLPVRAYLFDYPLPVGQPRLIKTLENTVVNSVAISEDGTQIIVNEGMKHEKYDALPPGPEGCSPTQPGVFGFCIEANRTESTASCSVTYRSLETGEVVAPREHALYACELPVGAMSSVKAKSLKRSRSLMRNGN